MKLKNIKKKIPDGTFAAMKISNESADALFEYATDNKIPNILQKNKYHATLLYSRKHLPKYKAKGNLREPLVGVAKKFNVFESSEEGKETNCLVLEIDCKDLVNRHLELMDKHGATFDYDQYTPHITLSYDIGDMDIKKLPSFEGEIVFTNEYSNDLDLSWTDKNC